MAGPWYRDGLRFACTRCGNCCTGPAPGFVWLSDAEIAALARLVELTDEQFRLVYTKRLPSGRVTLRENAHHDCVFYDAVQGCTVYSARPMQCRTWPFWESTAGTPEAWERTQGRCPGAGQGELIPSDEITRRMKAVKI